MESYVEAYMIEAPEEWATKIVKKMSSINSPEEIIAIEPAIEVRKKDTGECISIILKHSITKKER